MVNNEIFRNTVINIDLNLLRHNVREIKKEIGEDVCLMAVVKADGYGHGAREISKTLWENGVEYLAVATLKEALELRDFGITYPILVMGHTPNHLLKYVVEKDISQTIFSLEQGSILSELAKKENKLARVHIKVDTGFHRLGKMPSDEYLNEITELNKQENLEIEGIFSHLALASEEDNYAQAKMFEEFVSKLKARGCSFKYRHIADSIAAIDYPQYRYNMVRIGALLYGMRGFSKGFVDVKQVMSFKTKISQLHHIKKNEGVSYDYLWRAQRDSIIATLPFGYADGYPRNMRDKGYVVVNGKKAPLVGVICMDQCMADVTDIDEVKEGMDVVIYSETVENAMRIDEAAKLSGTNKNDILVRMSLRAERRYINE